MATRAVVSLMVTALANGAAGEVRLGGEFQANTHTTHDQAYSSVAAAPSGDFVMVWESYGQDGDGHGVFARRFDASGNPHAPEFPVNAYTTGSQWFPDVASDANGNWVAVWQSNSHELGPGLFARRYDSGGNPRGGEFAIEVDEYAEAPSVASAADGAFVVVWTSLGPYGQDVFGKRYDATGAAEGAAFLVNSQTAHAQRRPSVAANTDGTFVVAWESRYQDDDVSYGVFAQRYDSVGAPQGSEFPVNVYTTGYQGATDATMLRDGGFVLTWSSLFQDGDGWGIYGRRFEASGAPLEDEFRVNVSTGGHQVRPSVASGPGGGFAVVWAGRDSNGALDIVGRTFGASGIPEGDDFRLNTHTAHFQNRSRVAAAGGTFVVVWDSRDQDGDLYGVFGQRFAPEVIFADGFESGVP
jgi:hypothetical protein